MNPVRKKRALNILFVLLFSATGVSLILYSLNSNLDYFFTPTELKQENILLVPPNLIPLKLLSKFLR